MKVISLILRTIFLTGLFLSPLGGSAEEQQTPPSSNLKQVNVNTADAQLISTTLKGIGIAKAKAIIDYRENYGPFHTVEELASVSGIGNATLAKNLHLILVE